MNDITKFLAANIDLQNRTFKRQQYKKVIIRAYQNSKKVKNLHTHLYGVEEFDTLSVTNFDLNYIRNG